MRMREFVLKTIRKPLTYFFTSLSAACFLIGIMMFSVGILRAYPQYAFISLYALISVSLCVGLAYAIIKRSHFLVRTVAAILLVAGSYQIGAMAMFSLRLDYWTTMILFSLGAFALFFVLGRFWAFGAFDAAPSFYGLTLIFFLSTMYAARAWTALANVVVALCMGAYFLYAGRPRYTPIVLTVVCTAGTAFSLSSFTLETFNQQEALLIGACALAFSLSIYLTSNKLSKGRPTTSTSPRERFKHVGSSIRSHPTLTLGLTATTMIYVAAGLIFCRTLLQVDTTLALVAAETLTLLGLLVAPTRLTRIVFHVLASAVSCTIIWYSFMQTGQSWIFPAIFFACFFGIVLLKRSLFIPEAIGSFAGLASYYVLMMLTQWPLPLLTLIFAIFATISAVYCKLRNLPKYMPKIICASSTLLSATFLNLLATSLPPMFQVLLGLSFLAASVLLIYEGFQKESRAISIKAQENENTEC